MAIAPILVFPYWKKEFHVHVNASSIMLSIVLRQPGEGALNHPISFTSRKLLMTGNKLHHKKETMPWYGLCTLEVPTLLVGWTFENVHRSFKYEVPSQ